jgi:hypothetical protein
MNNFFEKYIGLPLKRWIEDFGGLEVIMVLGAIGIICAIIGHYGTLGFNWKFFVFFELPLYGFCGWAIWNIIKMYKHIRK